MLAVSSTYDIVLFLHILAAVATVVVLIVMRTSGMALISGADAERLKNRFPNRSNYAARIFHILPLTGLYMASTGGSDVNTHQPWVIIGAALYLLGAGHLEARTLPQEKAIGARLAAGEPVESAVGKKFVLSVDVLLGLVALALLAMIVQPTF